jgi:hypothetical protein
VSMWSSFTCVRTYIAQRIFIGSQEILENNFKSYLICQVTDENSLKLANSIKLI